ncbi:transcriptional regulator with PAS, ATPase and Fis domain [Bacillus mesophilus]|uniref:PAS domain-containing protein n=1 Tax=Bacillus mesophilus TaxID=1808955 RepID=A0A6M0Q8R6_9BACI|nr:sigma 54-interacting transcriptional regulator [Bacillus mesophilus]MBM7661886.1 transcriptional regulator with PAS, ATPase and Fis domain [Bacillus mesophilus]NEY72752.1 PAS domain-containing protein [Bacillus mesophilus]
MRKKKLVLLAGSKETRRALTEQLNDILGDFIEIESFSSEEGLPSLLENELVIYSSYLIENEVQHIIGDGCEIIISRRTINYRYIDQLLALPYGTHVLYVNDVPETVSESITTLMNLGIDHIVYHPYYIGKKDAPPLEIAVSPGEMELVPRSISKVINIGVRLIDITTIMTVLGKLQLPTELGWAVSDKYTKRIIDLSRKLTKVNLEANVLNRHLKKVVDGVNDGILAVDLKGKITVFNEVVGQMIGVSPDFAIGKHINTVVKNQELLHFIFNHKDDEDYLYFTLNQFNVMVYRFYMKFEHSIVATFKNVDETIKMEKVTRRELVTKGYVAKYNFDSIIGHSAALIGTKKVAKKLAKTELPLLIQGENGTGKELFASAIHNHSSRQNGPYLAVNCSALPEDLLESELFGYEEGAFTGAKKGGKKGLFEQADGGTILLDEIGDISIKLQARLLRVLQEMEIRRVGGNKNIPIDVRVISATNKNLSRMIDDGTFREDLYHRLKVLSLQIPPLRERSTDIPLLAEMFILQNGHTDIDVEPAVVKMLIQYKWNGNIRELKNTILYMLAVCDGKTITVDDLPNEVSSKREKATNPFTQGKDNILDKKDYYTILDCIYTINNKGVPASRVKITEEAEKTENPLTEQQIRLRLKELAEMGYVSIGRGRSGTKITEEGISYLSVNLL